MAMPKFSLPLSSRDQGWLDLRDRLACAAREMHFSAIAHHNNHSAHLLAIAGNLAALAMSIPMRPIQPVTGDAPDGLVEASTLVATQLLQHRPRQADNGTACDPTRDC